MSEQSVVVNVRTDKDLIDRLSKEGRYVYIGRPGPWGNPFAIGRDGTREEVIEKYREHILHNPRLLMDIQALNGKVLGCWCAPLPCHGDVIADLLKNGRTSEP